MNKKIEIISTVNAEVGMHLPELRVNRTWAKKGAKQALDFDLLQEALYDPGVENLFKSGVLYIEDMEVKIALGLEPYEAKQPENIIILNETQQKRYLTVAPVHEFKEILTKISKEQAKELVDMAIKLKVTDLEKTKLLKEATEIDVMKAIMLLEE